MAKETLYCETGNHKWTREAVRGRKPTSCSKHKPAVVVNRNPVNAQGKVTLHCETGNHDWERVPTRGRTPKNCPDHKPAMASTSIVRTANGNDTLHCEIGNHDWERVPTRGRKPINCPEHVPGPRAVGVRVVDGLDRNEVTLKTYDDGEELFLTLDEEFLASLSIPEPQEVKRGRGRPRIHETPEDAEKAALEKSRNRVTELERNLLARGTHLSQQTPYKLYKLVSGVAGTKKAKYEFVTEHSPLNRERFLNEHEAQFLTKEFRYERDGALVSA